MLGNEFFDVTVKPLTNEQQYLLVTHPSEGILQAQTKLESSMHFRPLSTSSNTHKKLTATVMVKHQKVYKTKMFNTNVNPEAAKLEAERVGIHWCSVRCYVATGAQTALL
jgi:hypothetical protein